MPGADALVPDPAQGRAGETVARLVDATSGLLDGGVEEDVTLSAIEEASGVSTGSLYHHFGDRGSAILAAHGRRFRRLMERQRELLLPVLATEDVTAALERCDALLADARADGGPRDRLTALSVLSAARHRPELRLRVAEELADTTAVIAVHVAASQAAGILDERLPPAATAVVLQALVVLSRSAAEAGPDVDEHGWFALVRALAHGLHLHDCPATCRLAAASAPLTGPTGPTGPKGHAPGSLREPADQERALFDVVIDVLARSGADAIVVRQVCAEAGVPLSTFHRRYGDRRHLIDAARLEVARRQAIREIEAFGGLLDGVSSSVALGERLVALVDDVGAIGDPGPHLERIDLIASAMFRPELVGDVGAVATASTDRIADVIAQAQARGLMRGDLAPRAVARLLWGLLSAGIVARLAGVTPRDWRELTDVLVRTLVEVPSPR